MSTTDICIRNDWQYIRQKIRQARTLTAHDMGTRDICIRNDWQKKTEDQAGMATTGT